MVPVLKSAITDLTTEEQYAEWVEPFVGKLVKICKPGYKVYLEQVDDPQEESKEPLTLRQKLTVSFNQYLQLIEDIEQQTISEQKYFELKTEQNKYQGEVVNLNQSKLFTV